MDPLADERRTDRGMPAAPSGEPAFSESQRLWLLERDLDNHDDRFDEFKMELRALRKEQKDEHQKLRDEVGGKLDGVNVKLWWLVVIFVGLLVTVIGVLVAALAAVQ